jgi:hypothetical protein
MTKYYGTWFPNVSIDLKTGENIFLDELNAATMSSFVFIFHIFIGVY